MATFTVTPNQLGAALRARGIMVADAIQKGLVSGARRGRAEMVRRSDDLGITDRGVYKNSWKVRDRRKTPVTYDGDQIIASLDNNTPYAGIIERGARPHPVSMQGLLNIVAWVERKRRDWLGEVNFLPRQANQTWHQARKSARQQAAYDIAVAIARKIKAHGQKGKFVLENAIPELAKIAGVEVAREVRDQANRKAALAAARRAKAGG